MEVIQILWETSFRKSNVSKYTKNANIQFPRDSILLLNCAVQLSSSGQRAFWAKSFSDDGEASSVKACKKKCCEHNGTCKVLSCWWNFFFSQQSLFMLKKLQNNVKDAGGLMHTNPGGERKIKKFHPFLMESYFLSASHISNMRRQIKFNTCRWIVTQT